MKLPKLNEERLLKKAQQYLDQIAVEQAWEPEDKARRWAEIREEVKATGTYTHTYEELAYGAQLAWRNASKCIGRIGWNNMVVRDRRHVTDPDEMFRELEEHLRLGTNSGNLQITMTVFRPKQPKERWGPRVWNPQLVRYAAYEQEDGSILGDPANLEVTKAIVKQGWQPPLERTPYDILPLVIEVPGMELKMYEFAPEDIHRSRDRASHNWRIQIFRLALVCHPSHQQLPHGYWWCHLRLHPLQRLVYGNRDHAGFPGRVPLQQDGGNRQRT